MHYKIGKHDIQHAFRCKSCQAVYLEKVTHCDCADYGAKQEWLLVFIGDVNLLTTLKNIETVTDLLDT